MNRDSGSRPTGRDVKQARGEARQSGPEASPESCSPTQPTVGQGEDMPQDTGASVPDQALVSDGAPSGLHPSGFDPSRKIRDLCLLVRRAVMNRPEDARLILEAVSDGQDAAREKMEKAYGVKDWAMQCAIGLAVSKRLSVQSKGRFAMGVAKGINPETASENERKILAIATEAGTAATVKQGAVHEGAGPQGHRP